MAIIIPFLFWLLSTAARVVLVLLVFHAVHHVSSTEPHHLLLICLPFLLELTALLATPFPPRVIDLNDVRRKQLRRSYLSTRDAERRNNLRANLIYLLIPGIATFAAEMATLSALCVEYPSDTKSALITTACIAACAWFIVLVVLKKFGPDYGPSSESVYHSHKEPPPKEKDASRTKGMEADALEDAW